jgi:hypothetical protein
MVAIDNDRFFPQKKIVTFHVESCQDRIYTKIVEFKAEMKACG